jgi:hypothetical protein
MLPSLRAIRSDTAFEIYGSAKLIGFLSADARFSILIVAEAFMSRKNSQCAEMTWSGRRAA